MTLNQQTRSQTWWYRYSRPADDDAYFENLCRIIFQTGLNWYVVEARWLTIKRAFCDFKVEEVADFTEKDKRQLLSNSGVIRNPYKIAAIINNAKLFRSIAKRCGSFQHYLDSLDKSNNYHAVVKELADNFERIGPTTAELFLYSVGENIKPSLIY